MTKLWSQIWNYNFSKTLDDCFSKT